MKNTLYVAILTMIALPAPALAEERAVVGEQAPDFELPDQEGQLHSLEDYLDSWVVLYFYPKDDTPGCTTEACGFRDNIFAYRKLNAQIIGVSLDDIESHSRVRRDPRPALPAARRYGRHSGRNLRCQDPSFGMPMAKRETFVIDPEGMLVRHYEDVDPDTHSAEVLADLKELAGAPTVSAAP